MAARSFRINAIVSLSGMTATAIAVIAMSACGDDPPATVATTEDAAVSGDGSTTTTGDGATTSDTSTTTIPGTLPAPDPSIAARAAVVLGSCVPDDGVHRYLADMYYERSYDPQTQLFFSTALECLATKNNGCKAIEDCLGAIIDVVATKEDCVRGCTGTTRTGCDGRLRFREDCARYGYECVADGRDTACAPPGAAKCPRDDAGVYKQTCQNDKPSYCNGPIETYGPDCKALGFECQSGGCKGTGGICTDNKGSGGPATIDYYDGLSCANNTLSSCLNGGVATVSCDALGKGFTCQSITLDGGKSEIYCGLGAECTAPSRANLQCDGDSVVVCNAGRIDKIDCKTLGFTGCSTQYRGCTPNLASTFVPDGG